MSGLDILEALIGLALCIAAAVGGFWVRRRMDTQMKQVGMLHGDVRVVEGLLRCVTDALNVPIPDRLRERKQSVFTKDLTDSERRILAEFRKTQISRLDLPSELELRRRASPTPAAPFQPPPPEPPPAEPTTAPEPEPEPEPDPELDLELELKEPES